MYANIYLRSTIFLRDNGLSFIVSLIAIKTPETNIINIPTIDKKNEVKIKEHYDKLKLINFNSILNEDQKQNIESIESKLNLIFYKLFELSPEEISIVENKYLKN